MTGKTVLITGGNAGLGLETAVALAAMSASVVITSRSVERGEGQLRDLDVLAIVSGQIGGKTLCAFGDAAITPVLTTLKHFRHEYEAHIREGRCPLVADWRAATPVGAH